MPLWPLTILLTALPLAAQGADSVDWPHCGESRTPSAPALEPDLESLHLSADSAELNRQGASILRGNVEAQKGFRQLQAETMTYHRETNVLDIVDGLHYWDQDMYISGSSGQFELDTETSRLDDVSYQLTGRHSRGTADHISTGGTDILLLENGTYTTCMPDDQSWELKADSIKLDNESNLGLARNVSVRFKDTPIFYSPILSFPISKQRKTGFLVPSFGSSEDTGAEISVPFYWNIAPEMDATFGVRAMSKRGAMLQGEYRYLLDRGEGELGVEYLPDDRQFDDSRGLYSFQHLQRFGESWGVDVDLNHVTDNDYFEDLGTDLSVSGRRFLDRRGDLSYHNGAWSALARLQTVQTIDDSIADLDKPYQRLPQLLLNRSTTSRNRTLNTEFNGEYVHFDRSKGVTGKRLDINPVINYPIRTPGSFLVPQLDLRYTHYGLDNQLAGLDDNISRGTATFSLDSGLFFEREASWGDRRYLQTLEPRLYYLYTPHEDQSDIPDFDTGEYTFSFAQLFRNNRFSGADRIGDANQATVALTSRWLDPTDGSEAFRASVGQIHYFRDRRVNLPGSAVEKDNNSDIVAEASAQIASHWHANAGIQLDNDNGNTERGSFLVRYQPDDRRVLNLGYRRIRGTLEQTDFSTRWPITGQLNFVGRWNYELPERRVLETFAGLEYDSCCWSLRTVVRRYLRGDSNNPDHNTGIYLQLHLKGLGGVGNRTQALLENQIPGYKNDF